jgi:hypothetical protein
MYVGVKRGFFRTPTKSKMMKPKRLAILLLLTLASCAPPTAVPVEPTIEMLTPEPLPGNTYLDACTHTLSYPP